MRDELYLAFENYLSNEMSVKDKIAFEKKLTEDSEFQADFNLYKETTTLTALKFSAESQDFKDNLKSIGTQFFTDAKPQKSKVIQLRPIFYAVAAVLLMFLGLQFFQNDPTFEEYNQFENASIGERGNEETRNLKKAEKAFNHKNYIEAISLFESVLKQKKTDDITYLYGIALLQENRTSEAEKVFGQLKSDKSIYKDNATWALALCKLQLKDYQACKALLLEIPEGTDYYESSRKLLKALN
jgi:tetratricopeptide (TPR) repeat protein